MNLPVPVLAVTVEEALGWAMTILDTTGGKLGITVIIFITVAAYVWSKFGGGRGE